MKKYITVFLLLFCMLMPLVLGACGTTNEKHAMNEDNDMEELTYTQISQAEAKNMMDTEENVIILDVREQHEYDEKHIPNAVLLPVGSIDEASAAAVIPTKDTLVLVYCRSGNRSMIASEELVKLGYSNIYEFGGIIQWPYEIEK